MPLLNIRRREAIGLLFATAVAPALAQQRPEVTVYKSPTCGCCNA